MSEEVAARDGCGVVKEGERGGVMAGYIGHHFEAVRPTELPSFLIITDIVKGCLLVEEHIHQVNFVLENVKLGYGFWIGWCCVCVGELPRKKTTL